MEEVRVKDLIVVVAVEGLELVVMELTPLEVMVVMEDHLAEVMVLMGLKHLEQVIMEEYLVVVEVVQWILIHLLMVILVVKVVLAL